MWGRTKKDLHALHTSDGLNASNILQLQQIKLHPLLRVLLHRFPRNIAAAQACASAQRALAGRIQTVDLNRRAWYSLDRRVRQLQLEVK